VRQGAVGAAAVLHQPAGELLDGCEVVVAGLRAEPGRGLSQVGQRRLDAGSGEVGDEPEAAGGDDPAGLCQLLVDVLAGAAPGAPPGARVTAATRKAMRKLLTIVLVETARLMLAILPNQQTENEKKRWTR